MQTPNTMDHEQIIKEIMQGGGFPVYYASQIYKHIMQFWSEDYTARLSFPAEACIGYVTELIATWHRKAGETTGALLVQAKMQAALGIQKL